MKFTAIITGLVALFAATSIAAPATVDTRSTPAYATVAFSNDQTGTWASAQIQLNPFDAGQTLKISDVWANTSLNKGGVFTATSASLVGGLARPVQCTIEAVPGIHIGRLTSRSTFTKLGGNAQVLQQVDLTNALITCIECEACQNW